MDPFGAVDSEMRSNWRSWSTVTVLDYSLEKLTKSQRITFLFFTTVLVSIAVIGNLATIIFNVRRQIRPLFRSCLISLTISDIITSVFASTTYFSQFIEEKTVLWTLGELLCNWIPFLTTQAILVNSITLVCIALDRYMAVVKVLKSSWEPKALSCIIGTIAVWAIGAGIASPMVAAYFIVDLTVAETDPNNRTIGIRKYDAQMCINDKSENASYYGIVFTSVFLPVVAAFLWLNATIAAEIWNRRNPLDQKINATTSHESSSPSSSGSGGSSTNPKRIEGSTSTGTKTTSNMSSSSIKSNKQQQQQIIGNNSPVAVDDNNQQLAVITGTTTAATTANEQEQREAAEPQQHQVAASKARKSYQSPSANNNSNNCRKTRQLRMFKVIIVIMTTFLVCRLPTWIFLLIKLNQDLSSSSSWIVHFSLGLLSLANCAINPFLYTFLTETMRFGAQVKGGLRKLCCFWCDPSSVSVEVDSSPGAVPREGNGRTMTLHRESAWSWLGCCWCGDPCGDELPDDKNLIDHCEYDDKHFRRKSYTLTGKDPLSCISSNVQPPFGHYANVYLGNNPPVPSTDPNHFVEVDLVQKK